MTTRVTIENGGAIGLHSFSPTTLKRLGITGRVLKLTVSPESYKIVDDHGISAEVPWDDTPQNQLKIVKFSVLGTDGTRTSYKVSPNGIIGAFELDGKTIHGAAGGVLFEHIREAQISQEKGIDFGL